MFIDHFLSQNFNRLFNENINNIEKKILYNVSENQKVFPKNFVGTFKWINSEKVMSNYRNIDFLERAFYGISQRVRKGDILKSAVYELKKDYKSFEERAINEFFYVKKESIKKFFENKVWF